MAGPSVHIGFPPSSLFKFPPDDAPPPLPPYYSGEPTLRSPFPIDGKLFQDLLSPKVPFTIASTYIVTVAVVNGLNRRWGNKPWAISKTRPFYVFVLLHNIFLAVYSSLTFYAILQALRTVWPGIHGEYGITEAVDAFCKGNGPRGLGAAATYNTTTATWGIRNQLYKLADNGNPDPTDVGRLWNEGLAFWGWFFYLSKFYEVLDTFIILAKGKRSSTLQTYHHAGAMLCMWAGIRYMAPPIWIFCFMNSFIHSLMYTYYTLSALGVRVPQAMKRTLTTMQITQFVVGASTAAIYLFISYTIPVNTPYTVVEHVQSVASAVSSSASSVLANVASATATASVGSYLKKLALLAAGEEGMAQNVRDSTQQPIIHAAVPEARSSEPIINTVRKSTTHYRNEYHRVHCVDTTGQAFSIWLNLVYLFPLTVLFVRFFIRSYTRRTSPSASHKTRHNALTKATKDAAHGVEREVESFGKATENGIQKIGKKAKAGANTKRLSESIQKLEQTVKESTSNLSDSITSNGEALLEKGKNLPENGGVRTPYKGEQAIQKKLEEALAEFRSESPVRGSGKKKSGKEQNGHPKGQREVHEGDGLSTTDPHDTDETYAEKLKH